MRDRTPFEDFHNRLRILASIDLHELEDAGVSMSEWLNFGIDPYRWFIRASDADAQALYRPEVRLRKLHLVRPDLIPYPIAYEVYC